MLPVPTHEHPVTPPMRNARSSLSLLAGLAVATSACADSSGGPVPLDTEGVDAALAAIEPSTIEHHMSVLSHDSLQGRAPGTAGYESAAIYAEERLRALGLEPAGSDGTWRQDVPLRHSTVVEDQSSLSVTFREAAPCPLHAPQSPCSNASCWPPP